MPKGKKPYTSTTQALIAYNNARGIDWLNLDWSMDNDTIAKMVGRAYNTVAKKRVELGKSGLATARKPRSDKGQSKPQLAYCGIKNQPLATKAAKQSLKSGKFESNIHAKCWRLVSPGGQVFEIRNLYQFVRNNPHLFSLIDTMWKRTGGKRGTGGEYCNATAGLLNVTSGKSKTWKGWTIEEIKPE